MVDDKPVDLPVVEHVALTAIKVKNNLKQPINTFILPFNTYKKPITTFIFPFNTYKQTY